KGKCRLSLAPTSKEKFEAGNFSRQYNLKSNNDDHLSTIEEPQIECKNNDHQLAESLSKLKVTLRNFLFKTSLN
ncbi:unnamed protein product, partial [Rotaria sp. Silwood2]